MTTTSTITQPAAPPAVKRPGVGVWLVTTIACLAQFMVVLDSAVVNVALPSMRHDLTLSVSGQQWVVDAYLLTFGGLLLFGARAGDLYGRRRVFQIGLALFTLSSVAGGLAPDGTVLLIARALQGVGAATLAPASLSLLMAAHPEPAARARALSIWAMAASSAAAAGVVLGGVLTEALGWRSVMFVNVPVGVGLVGATAYGLAPAIKGTATRVKLDVRGALTVTVGLSGAVYGLSQATRYGWGSGRVLIALIGAVVLLVAFVLTESRSAQPLVRLGILGLRNMRAANLAMLGFGTTITASLFFLSLYLQQLVGYSAIKTGLALLPLSVVLGAGNFVTRSLLARGVKHLAVVGALTAAGGMLWLTQLPAHPDYVSSVLLPTLVTGAGFALAMLPVISAATNGVAHHESGMASGLLNVSQRVGGALGLAILTTVATTLTSHDHHGGTSVAVLHGYHGAFLAAAIVCLLTAIGASRITAQPATKSAHNQSVSAGSHRKHRIDSRPPQSQQPAPKGS